MFSFADVDLICHTLPEVSRGTSYGHANWQVGKRGFAWERPLSKADIKRLAGAPAPAGPILAVSTADMADKAAVLSEEHPGVFTIEHFNNYPAVLIELDVVGADVLNDLILDAWLACAPAKLLETYLAEHPLSD